MSKHHFLKKALSWTAAGAGLAAYVYYQNYHVKQTNYYVESPIFTEDLNGYRIAQISDLHYPEQRVSLDDILNRIDEMKPNLIVMTGDNLAKSIKGFDEKEWYAFATALTQMAPTYAVSGENDLVNPLGRQAEQMLTKAGATYLNDEAVTLTAHGTPFVLMGLMEKPTKRFLKGNALQFIHLTPEQQSLPKLLLAHHPEAFLRYHEDITKSPDLVLSGHAHGGEIRVPHFGGIKAKNQGTLPKYTDGVFHIPGSPNKQMVISTGIAHGELPIRLNNCPEIVNVVLTDSRQSLSDNLQQAVETETALDGGYTVTRLQNDYEERKRAKYQQHSQESVEETESY